MASRALVDQYCVTCHNDRLKTGGLSLQSLDLTRVPAEAGVWEAVVRKVNAGMMPPPGLPRPSRQAADALVSFLTTDSDRAAVARPNPGRPLLHRLNRAEYANAIRDLLSLEVDVTSMLPPDDSSAGFDNNADVLGVSPVLMERYLSAAMVLSAMAVGDTEVPPAETTFRPRADTVQAHHLDGLPLGTRGGIVIRNTFPVDAEYVIKPTLWRNNAGRLRGMEHPHQLEILVDGRRVHTATIGTPEDFKITFDDRANTAMMPELDRRLQVRVPITAGPHVIGVTFAAKTAAQEPLKLRPFLNQADGVDTYGIPKVDTVTIVGPYNVTGSGDTPSRRAIFTCGPSAGSEPGRAATPDRQQELSCATAIMTRLARRAYRRTPTEADVKTLMTFYEAGRQEGTFDTGIQRALTRLLTSTEFVFRIEQDPAGAPAVHPVSDVELASRLSFFLWSSIPDDELLVAAQQGRLRQPAVLTQQTRRMLADPTRAGDGHQLRLAVAVSAQPAQRGAVRGRVPGFRRRPAAGVPARDRDAVRQHHAERPAGDGAADGRLHVRQRAPGQALRHPQHLRHPFPPRAGDAGRTARPARPRQHPHRDVERRPHVARSPRQVDPRERARHAAAVAARQRAAAQGEPRARDAAVDARPDGGAPPQPVVRQLPQADGSARIRARAVRRRRRLAGP